MKCEIFNTSLIKDAKTAISFMIILVVSIVVQSAKAQASGELWGVTGFGGQNNLGTIYRTAADGTGQLVKYNFTGGAAGENPQGNIVIINDKVYGMALGGSASKGILFEYNVLTNIYTKRVDFTGSNGGDPNNGNGLVVGPNGKLYGVTNAGGTTNEGVFFEFDPATNIYTKKADFGSIGKVPNGSLCAASNGNLYGLTNFGGVNNAGVIFEFDIANNQLTKKIDFVTSTGKYPFGTLLQATNGKLYGTTTEGGVNGTGVIFEYDPGTNVYTKKFDFGLVADGVNALGALAQASNGKLYGTTDIGAANALGMFYEFDPATNVFTKKFDFGGANGLGFPYSGATLSCSGKLYGATSNGGANNKGAVYEFDPITNVLTTRYSFGSGVNGAYPGFGELAVWRPSILSSTAGNNCGPGTVSLSVATSGDASAAWFTTSAGGTSISSLKTLVTPSIATTTTFYAEAVDNGCSSNSRTAVVATIKPVPTVAGSDVSRCDAGVVELMASSTGTINWFAASSGGSALATGPSFTTPNLTNTTPYFLEAVLDGCASTSRTQVNAIINPTPSQPTITVNNSNLAAPLLTSSSAVGNQLFKDDVIIPSATNNTYTISQAGSYKVQVTLSGCVSPISTPLAFVITGLETPTSKSVSLYPNPTGEELIVRLSGFETNKPVAVSIIDFLGRELKHTSGQGGEEVRLDVRSYPSGQYFVLMHQSQSRVVKSFIKKL